MFYLITGENTPIIEDEKNKIITNFEKIPFETLKETTSLESFIHNTEACDMFSPQKGQLLLDPKWLKKTSKEDLNKLNICLSTAKSFNLPIIIITKKIDKRSASYKLLKKHRIIEKDCPEFKEWESQKIIDWMIQYCKKKTTKIEPNAAQMLIDAYGSNLGIIKQELEKCMITILPETTITHEHLLYASSNAIGHYGQLSTALKKGHTQGIIKSIHKLIKCKEDPHKIFNQLLFQINQLLPIALAMNHQLSHEKIASTLGKHPFFIKKQMESLNQNPLRPKLPQIIGHLATIDQKIKTGKLSAKQAMNALSNTLNHQI